MENLEGATPQVEGAEKATTPSAEPTTRMYSQKEYDEGVGKGRASTQSQLSLSQAETRKLQATIEGYKTSVSSIEADLQELQKQYDDLVQKQFEGDPEARRAYIDRRAIADGQRKLAKEKAEAENMLYEAEKIKWQADMDIEANKWMAKTGIDINEFVGCVTKEDIKVKALEFQLAKEAEKSEKTPKFDSGISSGGGVSLKTLEQANEDFSKGLISKTQLREIKEKIR